MDKRENVYMNHETVRVWDLPTRLFHWALLACVIGLFVTAYAPGNWIDWHARLGFSVLALLLFRLVWGFIGGHWSRFATFLPSPGRILAHLRGQPGEAQWLGHNPLGSLSVLAMLAVLAAQVGTGLVADDEIAFTGPLNRFVSTASGLAATAWHKGWGQWLLLGLIGLHVAAIVFYARARRTDLVGPMLHGDKRVAGPAISARDDLVVRLCALVAFTACGAGVYVLVNLLPPA